MKSKFLTRLSGEFCGVSDMACSDCPKNPFTCHMRFRDARPELFYTTGSIHNLWELMVACDLAFHCKIIFANRYIVGDCSESLAVLMSDKQSRTIHLNRIECAAPGNFYGSYCVQYILAALKDIGYKRVFGVANAIHEQNPLKHHEMTKRLITWYKKFGFRVISENRPPVEGVDGLLLSAEMECDL